MEQPPIQMPSAFHKEMSGRLTNAIVQFARTRGLDVAALEEGLRVNGSGLGNVNAWVSAETLTTLMARLRRQTNQPDIMETVGLSVPKLKAFGFIGVAVFLLKDPPHVVNRLVMDLFDLFSKTSTMEVVELTPRHVIVAHRVRPGFPVSKDLCYFLRGVLRSMPQTWGLRLAELIEESCQAEGADACYYRIIWPKLGLWRRFVLWVRGGRMREKLVRLLTEQNLLIEEKYEEVLNKSAQLEEASLRIVISLMEALEAKDPYTRHHSRTVAAYATEIAKAYGMAEAEVEPIRRGALLHDIGKIGVSEAVLRKPGPLTHEETLHVRLHPALGEKILRPLSFIGLGPIVQIVAQEHERFDGGGYPAGLKGSQIDLGARIVSVADALDAITSLRPYRQTLTFHDAVAEIRCCANSQFDPEVVEAFLRALPKLENVYREQNHHAAHANESHGSS